jgi:DNA-binding response OmpR family regulator
MTRPPPPDIVLLATDWQPRTLIRAQLIEEGFEVAATDSWPMMQRYFGSDPIPQLAIVDLQGLPDPSSVLDDLRGLMKPERVLVLMAMATISKADLERLGFHVLARPFAIEEITRSAANLGAVGHGSRDHRGQSRAPASRSQGER